VSAPAVIFFDLDGCLVDSTRAITGAMNHALTSLNLPPRPLAGLTRFIGPPLMESFATLLREAGADAGLAPACVDAYRERYRTSSLEDTEVIAGMPEALDRLSSSSSRLGVVTSKPLLFAVPILERVGLRERFVAVHGPDADHRVEPKTVTLARALADIGEAADAASAVMVGDRSHDVIAGRACGIATVGVTWGAGDRAELVDAGADHVVDSAAELVALFEGARSQPLPRAGRRD